eukprot:2694839-Rhodomonas_salina.2
MARGVCRSLEVRTGPYLGVDESVMEGLPLDLPLLIEHTPGQDRTAGPSTRSTLQKRYRTQCP